MKRRASLAGRSGYVCQGKCAALEANKSSAHSEVESSSRLFASSLAYDTSVLPDWRSSRCSCDRRSLVAREARSLAWSRDCDRIRWGGAIARRTGHLLTPCTRVISFSASACVSDNVYACIQGVSRNIKLNNFFLRYKNIFVRNWALWIVLKLHYN